LNRSAHPIVTASFPLLVCALLVGCGPESAVDDVLDEDQYSDDELGTIEGELSRPVLRMPFRCGQTWSAATRASHSPSQAVDFNRDGDFGDAVVASAGGVVTRSESEGNTSYGNWVEIAHGNGYRTRYAHLRVRGVHVGQSVGRAQKIGEVGNSGGSTGPHLHYEQLLNGDSSSAGFNARRLFRDAVVPEPQRLLAAG
jgi:murein DD-endopeptidase MepM/ murein hydrolase activator NlpD